MTRLAEGDGELAVYFDPEISIDQKILFARYVHEHLSQKCAGLERTRSYVCPKCRTPVGSREIAMRRLNQWLEGGRASKSSSQAPTIICVECENRVALWDEMEELFASDETRRRVWELQRQSEAVLDNESKERALVGEVISTVALAGQISREFNVSDHGIDMEIEFKSDAGEAVGKKLYLQLKSGNSYLHERKGDGAEIFRIKDERHARYWDDQAFPVLLVVRNSEGEVRWMEIRSQLAAEGARGNKVRQIVFEGERFDVVSVRRWRDRMLRTNA